jgi:hypothetical protein
MSKPPIRIKWVLKLLQKTKMTYAQALLICKSGDFKKELNSTEPSLSVSSPCLASIIVSVQPEWEKHRQS